MKSAITAADGDGTMINSQFLDGLSTTDAFQIVAEKLEALSLDGRPVGKRQVRFRLQATGAFRASATGAARSPSSTARGAAWFRCRRRTCRSSCRKMRPSTSRAIRSTGIRRGSTACARSAASQRGARRTRWIRSSIVPGTTAASRRPTDVRHRCKGSELLAAGRSVHRRHRARDFASALFALLLPRDGRGRGTLLPA